jgi:hypothetical protein
VNLKRSLSAYALLALAAGCGQADPKIDAVTPSSGPAAGNTTISIAGENLRAGATVYVGGLECTNTQFVSTNLLVAETPASALGSYLVAVRNKDATTGHFYGFTYVSQVSSLTITSVTPDQGASGTAVTIMGSGFQANAIVTFGSIPATSIAVQNPQTITCFSPTGAGVVNVTVTNTDGSAGTLAAAYTYPTGTTAQAISTFAGTGTAGFTGDGGAATLAELSGPRGVVLAPDGSLYVADTGNNRVRHIVSGTITTVVGSGTQGFAGDSGPPASAELDGPEGLALDASGSLYIADTGNDVIRVVSGTITTIAGTGTHSGNTGDTGSAITALLAAPEAVAVDSAGIVYIADTGNNRVRVVQGGTINAFAGTGTSGFQGDNGAAISAELASPSGIVVEPSGTVWISDTGNARVRRVLSGIIMTEVGGGTGSSGSSGTGGSGLGGSGVGSTTSSTTTNSIGDGGPGVDAVLQAPAGLALDGNGNLLIADSVAQLVRTVDLNASTFTINTLAGNGTAGSSGDGGVSTQAELDEPRAVTGNATSTYIADTGNSRIRLVQ